MSYYSDVTIAIKDVDFAELIKELRLDLVEYARLLEDVNIFLAESVYILQFFISKWGTRAGYVNTISDFLKTKADGYGFVRIGEAYDDIEVIFAESSDGINFEDYLGVVRETSYPHTGIVQLES